MLHEIHIQNYAVIESLSVEFHAGLNILSGETGSGKSILVDALGLALGGRASPDVIRTGQERATVTAVFRTDRSPPWATWLEEYGLAGSDETEIILRREVQASGKSRLLVNDQPVTVAAVKALAPLLVEVHGQSEHVALLARDAQLDLLDQFAGTDEALQRVGELYARRRALEREMENLSQNEQERLRTIDLLAFQAQELERAKLEPGEDTRLEDEKRVLANLEKIRAAAASAFGELYEEEGSACSRLAVVGRALEELRRYDAAVENYLEPLAGTRATLEDLAFFLRDYLGKLQANPRRLEELEDRLALIDRLKRKYGKTIEEILTYRQQIQQQLASLEHADERRGEVARELEKVRGEYEKTAQLLSQQRREAGRKLERLIRDELAQLGMEKARFQVHFEALPAAAAEGASADVLRSASVGSAKGIDQIEFRISPNPGEDLRPLEKIASGGELSRLMLALKTVVGKARAGLTRGRAGQLKTFIFDEVDAGIGGRIAESVGQRLKRLARDAQVLCVTHLAQIACFADHHFYVEKFERAGRSLAVVRYLEGEKERVAELGRMLSGRQITEAVLKHAAAMLKQASGTSA
jgi:DNA repair protein RecN (Recombination protein N)